MTDAERIAAIEQRLAARTPDDSGLGWHIIKALDYGWLVAGADSEFGVIAEYIPTEADAELIANAPRDLAWLLKRLQPRRDDRD